MAETVEDKIMNILLGSAYYKYSQGRHNAGNHCGPAVFNESLDVLRKTCFTNYDTVACIRGTALVFLTAVTGMLCTTRVVSLHVSGHPNYYQYAIFYLAVIQCIVSCVEWVLGWTVHASLICLYLRCLELVVICHFYLTLACRVTRRSNGLASRLSAAVLSLFLTYFTSFMIIGLAFSGDTWCDCFANYWLFMSGGQLVLIQMFCTAAFLIIHRVNEVRAQESFKKAQKRGVWILVFAFEMSAVVSISYYTVMWALGTNEGGCSGIFLHKQWIYSPVRLIHEILASLLPFWAMLYVFKPLAGSVGGADDGANTLSTDRRNLINSSGGSQDSTMMDPSLITSPSLMREWRRRSRNQLLTISNARAQPDPSRARASTHLRARPRRLRSFVYGIKLFSSGASADSGGGSSRIRRCSSAPSTFKNKRTPPLATIPEEPAGNGHQSRDGSSSNSPPEPGTLQTGSVDVLGHYEPHLEGRSSAPAPAVDSDIDSSQEQGKEQQH